MKSLSGVDRGGCGDTPHLPARGNRNQPFGCCLNWQEAFERASRLVGGLADVDAADGEKPPSPETGWAGAAEAGNKDTSSEPFSRGACEIGKHRCPRDDQGSFPGEAGNPPGCANHELQAAQAGQSPSSGKEAVPAASQSATNQPASRSTA